MRHRPNTSEAAAPRRSRFGAVAVACLSAGAGLLFASPAAAEEGIEAPLAGSAVDAAVELLQASPTNLHVSIRIGSPGDDGTVTQENVALAEAATAVVVEPVVPPETLPVEPPQAAVDVDTAPAPEAALAPEEPIAAPSTERYHDEDTQYQPPEEEPAPAVVEPAPAAPPAAAETGGSWTWTWNWDCGGAQPQEPLQGSDEALPVGSWTWIWNWSCPAASSSPDGVISGAATSSAEGTTAGSAGAGSVTGEESGARYHAPLIRYQPINVVVSVRVNSPGANGPVMQTNIAASLAVATVRQSVVAAPAAQLPSAVQVVAAVAASAGSAWAAAVEAGALPPLALPPAFPFLGDAGSLAPGGELAQPSGLTGALLAAETAPSTGAAVGPQAPRAAAGHAVRSGPHAPSEDSAGHRRRPERDAPSAPPLPSPPSAAAAAGAAGGGDGGFGPLLVILAALAAAIPPLASSRLPGSRTRRPREPAGSALERPG